MISEITSDINKLSSIRNPAFGKGDRKSMTLLPSFNGKERRTGEEIPTSRDYLITGVKRFRYASPKFFLISTVRKVIKKRKWNDILFNRLSFYYYRNEVGG